MKTMALNNKHIMLVIALSFLLSALSGEANFSSGGAVSAPPTSDSPKGHPAYAPRPATTTGGDSPSPSPLPSYISSTPKGSPVPSPSIAKESIFDVTVDATSEEAAPAPSPSIKKKSIFDLISDVTSGEVSSSPEATPSDDGFVSDLPIDQQDAANKFLEASFLGVIGKIEKFSLVLEKKLDDPNTDENTKQCLNQCKEVYAGAVDALFKAHSDVAEGNLYKANVDVSAFSTEIETCEDCFIESSEEDEEVKKFDTWAQGVASDCLGKIDLLSRK